MERKRFYQYLWSAILTSLSGTLCVQIDGIIVSHLLGANAFAAIGALMPLVQIQLTLCLLVGIGGAVYLAVAVGADDKPLCTRTFQLTLLSLLILGVPFMLTAWQSEWVASCFCHATEIVPFAADYARVLLLSAPFYLLLQGSGALVRAEGFPKRVLYAIIIANCLNLCGDFLFISGLHMGIAGAAWSTTLSNMVATVIILLRQSPYMVETKGISTLSNRKILSQLLLTGAPVALASVAMFLRLSYLTGTISELLGAEGIVVLSFVMSIFLLINLLVAGTTQALQPLAGQYIGQGDEPALYRTCRRALSFTLASSLFMTLLMIVLAKPFCHLYGVADHIGAAVPALRIFALSATFSSLGYVMMVIHQVMGNKVKSIVLAVLQPILLIPVFYLFTTPILPSGINYIWWSFLIAESINLIIVIILSHHVLTSIFTTRTRH
ncbi:MAG: polysaccharide biosynthesis C-terminal domain-containing protein [Paludibacteraceae bacterium]|nr:polysaccharide biosynthesis C-terminal domain-containing protein [Paludibacteraceae bacterium]